MLTALFEKYLPKIFIRDENYVISRAEDGKIDRLVKQADEMNVGKTFQSAPKILFIPSYYQIGFTRLCDIFMFLSLYVRGARIISVLMDDFYSKEHPIWSGNYGKNTKENIKKLDTVTGRIWNELLKTESVCLRDFRKDQDLRRSGRMAGKITFANYKKAVYKGYPIGNEAGKVVANVNDISYVENTPKVMNQLREHVKNIVQIIDAYERLIDYVKPDVIFSNHPFYYMWGAAWQAAKNRDISFYSMGMGERKNTRYFVSDTNKIYDFLPGWPSFKKKRLDVKTDKLIDQAITKRMNGEDFSLPHYKKKEKGGESSKLKFWIDGKKPVIFFPVNVPSDASILGKPYVFSSLFDMIDSVISYFNHHPEFQLIIKAHPAEEQHYRGPPGMDRYCLRNVIKGQHEKLGKNIYFLDYDKQITSFEIIPFVDLGIMYTSSVAMEMAWVGKPSITCAESFYSGIGYSYEPKTKEKFFGLINTLIQTKKENAVIADRIEASRKFYYFYYCHGCVDFKLFQGNDLGNIPCKFLFRKIDDIMPGRNKALDYICDSLLNKRPIFGNNRWPPVTYY